MAIIRPNSAAVVLMHPAVAKSWIFTASCATGNRLCIERAACSLFLNQVQKYADALKTRVHSVFSTLRLLRFLAAQHRALAGAAVIGDADLHVRMARGVKRLARLVPQVGHSQPARLLARL